MATSLGSGTDVQAGQLEVAHFYGEGDGQRAIQQVFDLFESRHTGTEIVGSSYGNNTYGLEIKCRILGENSPSVFMSWPGRDLEPYYRAGAVADLTDFWAEHDLADVFIEGPRDLVRFDGRFAAIPVDIHRKNNLFYNVELVEQLGIDPHSIGDPREFLEVLRQCRSGPAIGMTQPMKNPWTTLQLWAQIVVGLFGPDTYDSMSHGDATRYRSEIEESLRVLDQYADLADDDAYFLDMVGANDRFIEGESVFFHQGDWVAGEYGATEGFDYRRDWDHVPFPGTDGTYVMGMDAITRAPDPPSPDAAEAFLEVAASRQAQQALNREKGSIPPRRDVSLDDYPPFLQDQYDDFTRSRAQVGGQKSQAQPDAFMELRGAFAEFASSRDVDATVDKLVGAYTRS